MNRGEQASARPGPDAPANFAVECPGCRAHLAATAMLAGGRAVCPICRAEFLVPRAAPTEAGDAPVVLTEPPLPSTRRRPDDAFVVAEADAGAAAADASSFALREPVRTISAGGTEFELRRLSRDERRRRRTRRTLVILAVGAAVLVALVVLLGAPPRVPRRPGSP